MHDEYSRRLLKDDKPHLSWTTPDPDKFTRLEQFALAMLLRVYKTGKAIHKVRHPPYETNDQRAVAMAPSVLNEEDARHLAPNLSFIRDLLGQRSDVKTTGEMENMLRELGVPAERLKKWIIEHPAEVERTEKDLQDLTAAPGRLGFSVMG